MMSLVGTISEYLTILVIHFSAFGMWTFVLLSASVFCQVSAASLKPTYPPVWLVLGTLSTEVKEHSLPSFEW